VGDPDRSAGKAVWVNKPTKQGHRDGAQEVREGILPQKLGNASGGKALR